MVNLDLNGKHALVTGGSRGLGKAMAKGLAAAGATVIVASRKLDACEQVCEEIVAAGGQAIAVAAHMGDLHSLNAMTRVMAAEWAADNIQVNAIAPGSYHSDLFDATAAAVPGLTCRVHYRGWAVKRPSASPVFRSGPAC